MTLLVIYLLFFKRKGKTRESSFYFLGIYFLSSSSEMSILIAEQSVAVAVAALFPERVSCSNFLSILAWTSSSTRN